MQITILKDDNFEIVKELVRQANEHDVHRMFNICDALSRLMSRDMIDSLEYFVKNGPVKAHEAKARFMTMTQTLFDLGLIVYVAKSDEAFCFGATPIAATIVKAFYAPDRLIEKATAATVQRDMLKKVMQMLAQWPDCGCVPCRGQCRSEASLTEELEARVVEAQIVLKEIEKYELP